MFCEIKIKNKKLRINLKQPIDISIPVKNKGVKGWGLDFAKIDYVKNKYFIGNINKEYTKIFIFVISIPDVIGSIGILAFL